MRYPTATLTAVAVVLATAGALAQAKPSFAGEWKMVTEHGQSEPGVDLVITQDATSMIVDYRRGGPATGPATLTCTFDGAASGNAPAARREAAAPAARPSKAAWTGHAIVVTTATTAGEEKRTFSMNGGDLVVVTVTPARAGANVATATYKRYQRGFGG